MNRQPRTRLSPCHEANEVRENVTFGATQDGVSSGSGWWSQWKKGMDSMRGNGHQSAANVPKSRKFMN